MSGIRVRRCTSCGWSGFPDRLWCPRCGAARFQARRHSRGVVEEVTELRFATGRQLDARVRVATVRLASGVRLIARLAPGPGAGEAVRVDEEQGVPVARPLAVRGREGS